MLAIARRLSAHWLESSDCTAFAFSPLSGYCLASSMQVVLLHALARTGRSMQPLANALAQAGHQPHVISYPSCSLSLGAIAQFVWQELQQRGLDALGDQLGFVGHSMGGVVYRALALAAPGFQCGRSVTVGSPVCGSIVADTLQHYRALRPIYGDAFRQLSPVSVSQLPQFPGPTGCIAGTHRLAAVPAYWVLAAVAKGQAHDSTVLVREALHPSACAQLQVPVAHYYLPASRRVSRAVVHFLAHGEFEA